MTFIRRAKRECGVRTFVHPAGVPNLREARTRPASCLVHSPTGLLSLPRVPESAPDDYPRHPQSHLARCRMPRGGADPLGPSGPPLDVGRQPPKAAAPSPTRPRASPCKAELVEGRGTRRDACLQSGRLDLNQRPFGPQPTGSWCRCVRERPDRPIRPRSWTIWTHRTMRWVPKRYHRALLTPPLRI